jgi:S-methylmethionine-dependent homocysteine/selenocysteine methylase
VRHDRQRLTLDVEACEHVAGCESELQHLQRDSTAHRHLLLGSDLFLTDGGLETTLIFDEGFDLPCFASFTLLRSDDGVATLERCFERYIAIARERRCGIVLEAPTWRANRDWGARLGYDSAALREANMASIELLVGLRERHETPSTPIVISGNLGPRGDGYRADSRMGIGEARDYHFEQLATFAQTDADLCAAFTMNYAEEAIGIALAARALAMPLVLSFTVETAGRLPSGESLATAMRRVEEASDAYPAYYMLNCAHPSHFESVLGSLGGLCERLRGLRANASCRSHAELDASTDLDRGDPVALARDYGRLRGSLPRLAFVGGCCGTDHRHVACIADVLVAAR